MSVDVVLAFGAWRALADTTEMLAIRCSLQLLQACDLQEFLDRNADRRMNTFLPLAYVFSYREWPANDHVYPPCSNY